MTVNIPVSSPCFPAQNGYKMNRLTSFLRALPAYPADFMRQFSSVKKRKTQAEESRHVAACQRIFYEIRHKKLRNPPGDETLAAQKSLNAIVAG